METWVITGANRGIGRELVRQCLEQGHNVIATVRPGKQAELDDIASMHLKIVSLEASDPNSITALAREIQGPVDVLINNAGIIGQTNRNTLVADLDWAQFEAVLRVNTIAPLFIARALLPHLRRGQTPRIASISSSMGSMSYAKSDTSAYRASKAALNKLMQALATDLGPENIPVVAVHPGWVRTDMGGQHADLDVSTSAGGIIRLISKLTMAESGKFFNYNGKPAQF